MQVERKKKSRVDYTYIGIYFKPKMINRDKEGYKGVNSSRTYNNHKYVNPTLEYLNILSKYY